MSLRLKAVAGDPLRGDAFVLHLVAHFVADVGVGTFVRGSAVSAFCDSHVVDILGAPQAQCARSATIWASGRTRDPYFEILGAPRGIMVTPSGGFEF